MDESELTVTGNVRVQTTRHEPPLAGYFTFTADFTAPAHIDIYRDGQVCRVIPLDDAMAEALVDVFDINLRLDLSRIPYE